MMKRKSILSIVLILCMSFSLMLTGCGTEETPADDNQQGEAQESGEEQEAGEFDINGLTYVDDVQLDYAEQFAIHRYEGGYYLIDIFNDAKYLVVPEGGDYPKDVASDIKIIRQPVNNIYLAATATMALFDAIDALDSITMTSIKESAWTIENAVKAMKEKKMVYAGKYSEPDYEMILGNGCELAIESTMIYHNPDVKEMIEELGVTVLVDNSSYESNPMGRTEWVKLYGVLTGKEEEAESFFDSQKSVIADLSNYENTGKVVAFFYVTTDGKAVVRSSSDYVPTMISMAGGVYAFDGVLDEDGKTSVSMTMESFYEMAKEADYIIYNASIDSTVKSVDDLIAKDEIFKEFKAVKEDKCYSTGSNMYQRTDVISNMIVDFHKVFTEEDSSDLEFLSKLK